MSPDNRVGLKPSETFLHCAMRDMAAVTKSKSQPLSSTFQDQSKN